MLAAMSKYLRNQFACLGIKKPERTAAQKQVFAGGSLCSVVQQNGLSPPPAGHSLALSTCPCMCSFPFTSLGSFPAPQCPCTHKRSQQWRFTLDVVVGLACVQSLSVPRSKCSQKCSSIYGTRCEMIMMMSCRVGCFAALSMCRTRARTHARTPHAHHHYHAHTCTLARMLALYACVERA
jgi:hypothetical protein